MRISWDIIGIKWPTEENYNDLWLSDATGTMGISSARSMQNTVGLYGQRSPYVLNHCQHQADQWDISWYITHGAWQVEAITWWRKRWEPQSPWAGSWFSLSVKFWVVSGRCWMKMDKDVDKGYMFWTSTWFLGTPRIVSKPFCPVFWLCCWAIASNWYVMAIYDGRKPWHVLSVLRTYSLPTTY